MTLYRDIILQALKSTWKNKYLWFFGLFAALIGNVGEFELIFRGFSDRSYPLFPGLDGLGETGLFSWGAVKGAFQLAQNDPFSLFLALGVLLLILIISVFFLWLAVTSQGALVHSAARIRTDKSHSLKKSLKVGMEKFWPVLGMNALLRAAMFALFFVLSLPIILMVGSVQGAAANFLYILAFIVFVPIVVVMSFIVKYAIAFAVIKNTGFWQSFRRGWMLFTRNWLVSLEMAFLLFFINFLVGLGVVLVFLVLAIPFLFMAFVFAKFSLFFNFWLIVVLALLAYVVFIALTGAFLSVFRITSWTALFIELISRGGVSKLVRIFGKE